MPAIWSNFASTKYPQVQRSGTERQSSKRRRAGQCSSRLRSRRGLPSKSGYEFSARLVLDISSRADFHARPHLSTRQYSRLVHRWVDSIGLKSTFHGTHSMRRTKVTQIYRKTGNLRAVQLLLGHTKLESTVRHLGIEVDDALHIAEQIEL